MKMTTRRPAFFILAVLAVVALVSSFAIRNGEVPKAYAASTATPTITTSTLIVHPNQKITVTGQGFAPGDTVFIYLDQSDNSASFGSLSCDSDGNCSGNVTIPTFGAGLQGQHILIGVGSQSNETAYTPITINPGVFLNLTEGGPGSVLQLDGFAFTANETVSIYWGTSSGLLEGTATTDTDGTFVFNFQVPTGLAADTYPVTVVRSGQKPVNVATHFAVLPAKIVTPLNVHGRQGFHVQLNGFQAFEGVTISWNANGGQQMGVVRVGRDGSIDENIPLFIVSAPRGTYTVNAVGNISGLKASTSTNIDPGITITSMNGISPGGPIIVNGAGFTPNETVSVYVQGQKAGKISVTTDATGSFQATITAPTSYIPDTEYFVKATNDTGSDKARSGFYFIEPTINWIDNVDGTTNLTYGDPGTLTGEGFLAGEQVQIYWNYQQQGQVEAATVIATDGTFSLTLNTPSSPGSGFRQATIEAIGTTSNLQASNQEAVSPAIHLSSAFGQAGQLVQVHGGSFASNVPVSITVNENEVGVVNTDSDGTFSTSITIPVPSANSINVLTVTANDDQNVWASTIFVLAGQLAITPSTGPTETSITLSGSSLGSMDEIEIFWYDPSSGSTQDLGTVSSDSAGNLNTTITAPADLISGHQYSVQLFYWYAGNEYLATQATFTAQ